MGQKETKAANESAAPPRLEEVLLRAAAGDRNVLPRLRELLRAPLLTELLGNLARHAQQVIINGLCGTDLATREGLEKKMAELRSELAGPRPSPLERQLAERVALCWLAVYEAELQAARAGERNPERAAYWHKRLDAAHRRHLSAVKALAAIRKLVVPVRIGQVNIADRQVNQVEVRAPGGAERERTGTGPRGIE